MNATAQKTESYYDWNWKPCEAIKARFYSTLEKTDSGWLRYDYFLSGLKLQMKALFEDSACKIHNGHSVYAYANGKIESFGRQIHNKREGICMSFYSNGMMRDSATYHNDRAVGEKLSWWPNGMSADSVGHVNDSMDVEVSWFDNGAVSQAGYLLNGQMQGKWQFFNRDGQLTAMEKYDHGKVLSKEFYKPDGSPLTDTSKVNTEASFKGGMNGWANYLGKNLYWPPDYKFTNGDMATVVIQITINEEGKPEDVEVVTPFHPSFDKIALDIVRRSPAWTPATSHNRKVKKFFRQPVTFQQPEQ